MSSASSSIPPSTRDGGSMADAQAQGVPNGEGDVGVSPASPAAAQNQTVSGSPNDFLKKVIGQSVVVRLNSGIDYRGILSCLDGYMNIALEHTSEWVDGQERNRYGDAFIRGNNVLYITAAPTE